MTACKAADLEDHFRSRPQSMRVNDTQRRFPDLIRNLFFSARQKSLAGKGKLMYDIHGQRACPIASSVTREFLMELRNCCGQMSFIFL